MCCVPPDLRGDGEAEGRHVGDDPVKSSRSPHRATHQVPRLTGTVLVNLLILSVVTIIIITCGPSHLKL